MVSAVAQRQISAGVRDAALSDSNMMGDLLTKQTLNSASPNPT